MTKASAITINEVLYDATGTDTGKEWIEFFNEDSVSMTITGYDLSAHVGDYYTFPEFTLLPESYVVVHWNTVGINTSTDLYTGNLVGAMSNTSGFVALFNSTTHNSSTIFDYVEYSASAGGQTWESDAVSAGIWTTGDFVADVVAGSSIGLKADGMDNNLPSDWTQFNNPTPGANNEPIPEPGTLTLLCIGVLALGLLMKKKIAKHYLDADACPRPNARLPICRVGIHPGGKTCLPARTYHSVRAGWRERRLSRLFKHKKEQFQL